MITNHHAVRPASLLALVLAASTMASSGASAFAAPVIRNIMPRGLQIGATNVITIDGSNLRAAKLLLPIDVDDVAEAPIANNSLQLRVTVPAGTAPGIYPLRLANETGISSPVAICVDALSQQNFQPEASTLPVALHGNLAGAQVLGTTISGKAGQRLVVEIEAQRLGGGLRPVLRLLNSDQEQLASAHPLTTLHGDCRLVHTLPADGTYTIDLRDAQYSAAGPTHFRMKLGDLPTCDYAFPLGVTRGTTAGVSLKGIGVDAEVNVATTLADTAPATWPSDSLLSGLSPIVEVTDGPQLVEPTVATEAIAGKFPLGISGRLSDSSRDRLLIDVAGGEKLSFELRAERIGSAQDGVLVVRAVGGGQLARGDDQADTVDPRADVNVPGNIKQLEVFVEDLLGRSSDELYYYLSVTDRSAPNFSLTVDQGQIQVPEAGLTVIEVKATRTNLNEAIALSLAPEAAASFELLPPATIPAGEDTALVSIRAKASAGTAVVAQLQGTASNAQISRPVLVPVDSLSRLQPWLRTQVGLAVTSATPLELALTPGILGNNLPRGGSLTAEVAIDRKQLTGPVRLVLETTQVVPPIAEGKDKGKPDPSRAIRLAKAVEIEPAENAANLKVLVPADLAGGVYDLALRAELLSPDKKNVLQTAAVPVLRLEPINLLKVELTSPAKLQATIGDGQTGKLTGKLIRMAGYEGPVELGFTGLPKDVMSPMVTVPADTSDFEFEVRFPANTKKRELKKVALVAIGTTDEDQPGQAPKSAEIPVEIELVTP